MQEGNKQIHHTHTAFLASYVDAAEKLIIIIFIYRNWVVTRWQWLFYMYTEYEIGYYRI